MLDWTGGYVTDLAYTAHFYRELAPSNLNFATALRGVNMPAPKEQYRWLELGCGQGLTANILAAANPQSEFYACDFMPGHIVNARQLALEANLTNIEFLEVSFEELLDADLPKMDYIVLHGVYSWVSEENRNHIRAIISKFLKPGGYIYISYNCLPGWAAKSPVRRLMFEISKRQAGTTRQKIDQTRQLLTKFTESDAKFFRLASTAQTLVQGIQSQNPSYLAHEYLNEHWDLFYHADVAADMASVKSSFVASAMLMENAPEACLSAHAIELLKTADDSIMYETIKDFCINQQFRRDIFVKGPKRYARQQLSEAMSNTRFCLAQPVHDCNLKVELIAGEANLDPTVYLNMLRALEVEPKTVAELAGVANISLMGASNALAIMSTLSYVKVMVVADKAAVESCAKFNSIALSYAARGEEFEVLAAPLLGSGMPVSAIRQLFLLAMSRSRGDLAVFAWEVMRELGQKIQKEGRAIQDESESLFLLEKEAEKFLQFFLPIYKMWGII